MSVRLMRVIRSPRFTDFNVPVLISRYIVRLEQPNMVEASFTLRMSLDVRPSTFRNFIKWVSRLEACTFSSRCRAL